MAVQSNLAALMAMGSPAAGRNPAIGVVPQGGGQLAQYLAQLQARQGMRPMQAQPQPVPQMAAQPSMGMGSLQSVLPYR